MLKTKLSLLTLLIVQNVSAETVKAPQENIERIVVTGSRIVESITEVPATITIINRQQIEAQLKVSPELQSLLAALVPGLAPSTGSSSNSSQMARTSVRCCFSKGG